jgi:hypothetical protein
MKSLKNPGTGLAEGDTLTITTTGTTDNAYRDRETLPNNHIAKPFFPDVRGSRKDFRDRSASSRSWNKRACHLFFLIEQKGAKYAKRRDLCDLGGLLSRILE